MTNNENKVILSEKFSYRLLEYTGLHYQKVFSKFFGKKR